ncbi:IBR finger domain-containing protein [Fusarium acuminatum]|uniref:IBR finger domain-containing protein n=1 Tax=Fusarium acuminatum TaxID=5515 RepID=A0ABZ2WQ54_9HYPO
MHDQVSTDDESDDSDELPNTVASPTDEVSDTDILDCAVCLEEFTVAEIIEVPCGHDLCETCIIRFVERSIADETLFPPQCCQQEIPIEVNSFLSHDLVDLFEKKKVEYETVNRTYCSNQRCSQFIPPFCIDDDDATCNDCGHLTCATCKASAHAGPCGGDAETQGLLALAEREGWRRCSKCGLEPP